MSDSIVKSAKKSAADEARKIAKQVAREPLEVAKSAGRQAAGVESQPVQQQPPAVAGKQPEGVSPQEEQKIRERGQRVLQALESELGDIRRRKAFEGVQRRIAGGETVNLASIEGLSPEQKNALNAQMQAAKAQRESAKASEPLAEPQTKQRRNIFSGMKGKVSRLKRKTELRLPPTG